MKNDSKNFDTMIQDPTNNIDYELHLSEQAIFLDLGLDNNNAIWTSIDKVITETSRNIDAVYKKLFEEGIITEMGWEKELLHSGAVITHTFCKDPMPGAQNSIPKVYENTLLSPSGVTYLRAFMNKFLPQ